MNEKALAAAVAVLKKRNPHKLDPSSAIDELFEDDYFVDTFEVEAYDVVVEALRLARSEVAPPAPKPNPRSVPQRGPAQGGAGSFGKPTQTVGSAPFRFVQLQTDVTMPEGDHRHDRPVPGGFCATIHVEWAAETPLLIGGGDAPNENAPISPMRLPGSDTYVLPGASLRGMVRAATEIVALGRLGAANLHIRYGIRDFEHPWYSEQDVSKVGKLQVGWLTVRGEKDKERAFITPIEPGEWAHIYIEDMIEQAPFAKTIGSRSDWLNRPLVSKGNKVGKYEVAGMTLSGLPAFTAKTARTFASMPTEGDRAMARLGGKQKGWLVFSGPLPGTDGNKKREYVFYDEASPNEPVELVPHAWETFKRLHSKPSKNRPEPDGSWADLKKVVDRGRDVPLDADVWLETKPEGQARRIPIFYVGDLRDQSSDKFAFGLTRLFKIPHRRAVRDVLPRRGAGPSDHDPADAFIIEDGVDGKRHVTGYKPDFVEMLFGHLEEPQDALGQELDASIAPAATARKGRVAFSFARLVETGSAVPSGPVTVVQMAPRASFSPFYLAGATAEGRDYSAPDRAESQIAGRKRYIPRHIGTSSDGVIRDIAEQGRRQIEPPGARMPLPRSVQSDLTFLTPSGGRKDIRFASEIRLHNVTAAELGAILFALTHGGDPAKPYRHMLGRAKAFGAGQVRIQSARLSVKPNDTKAADLLLPPSADEIVSADGLHGFCPTGEPDTLRNASHRPFLKAFEAHVQKEHRIPELAAHPTIREFLGACSPEDGAAAAKEGRLAYMELTEFTKVKKQDRVSRLGGRLLGAPARPLRKTSR